MSHITCRLTAKKWDQLWNPMLGNRVRATFLIKGKQNNVTGIHSNTTKSSVNSLPLYTGNYPKPTGLYKDFQKPPSFSRTFKAMNLQLLNSRTFKDPVVP